jgi:mycoredoxin-dependent peroxiredoxin
VPPPFSPSSVTSSGCESASGRTARRPATAVSPKTITEEVNMPLTVGDSAPDFSLRDANRNKVSLADFKGQKTIVLAFYILAFTPG